MVIKPFIKITLNSLAIVLLLSLLATPFYFAKNIGKVAGVKSQSKYFLVSQIENFPNLSYSQTQDTYKVNFTKFGQKQAYINVFIINNPTENTQVYKIEKISGNATVFFGEDTENKVQKISLPQSTSSTLSIISEEENQENQIVEFKIEVL